MVDKGGDTHTTETGKERKSLSGARNSRLKSEMFSIENLLASSPGKLSASPITNSATSTSRPMATLQGFRTGWELAPLHTIPQPPFQALFPAPTSFPFSHDYFGESLFIPSVIFLCLFNREVCRRVLTNCTEMVEIIDIQCFKMHAAL